MQTHERDQVVAALLDQVKTECLAQKNDEEIQHPQFSTQVQNSLTTLFPAVLSSAFHILDHGKVTKFVCQDSRRAFYRVEESSSQSQTSNKPHSERTASGRIYYDIMGDFCCCFWYTKHCLNPQGISFLCKHVLAAKLAEAISHGFEDKLHVKEIQDIDFGPLFLSSRNHLAKFSESKLTQ